MRTKRINLTELVKMKKKIAYFCILTKIYMANETKLEHELLIAEKYDNFPIRSERN